LTFAPAELAGPDGTASAVVHVAAELAPYARTGGLGEAVASLAHFQAKAGLEVAVMMPLYREVARKYPGLEKLGEPFSVIVGGRTEEGQLYQDPARSKGKHPRTIFVANQQYFDRDGIYGDGSSDYPDNARRYAFFCLGALEAIDRLFDKAQPVVLHAHDWHAALASVYQRSWLRDHPSYARVATVLSVHNAGFQGHFPPGVIPDLGLSWELYTPHAMEWYGKANVLKGGMAFADAVTTVSPTHAVELRTPGGGFGLDATFASLPYFAGITNGIDLDAWNPATDRQITATFTADDLSGKARCKTSVQRLFALPQRARIPLVAMSARMVYQKGLDLILESGFLSLDAQFVFLGAGEPRYERALAELARAHRDRIGVQTNFTDRFEHRLIAGADLCLMPSMYEPCGLTQMRAQRYGTLPLARRVGGLADTIDDGVTGFLFDDYTAASFLEGTVRAVRAYADEPRWRTMQREAMSRDFGWARAERKYMTVYQYALSKHLG
jgi:starch synthase